MFGRRRNSGRIVRRHEDVDPDEIFLDSKNLPAFDTDHFEGRIERPIGRPTFTVAAAAFSALAVVLLLQTWVLQVRNGEANVRQSESNRLSREPIFGSRGIIYDRSGNELAWNVSGRDADAFPARRYIRDGGFAHILGYVSYPKRDASGNYYQSSIEGIEGVELSYDDVLSSVDGVELTERNAVGELMSNATVRPPQDGGSLTLSIDLELESELYRAIERLAREVGFRGGAGVIMDVASGEILALTSYPEFDLNALTEGDASAIESYRSDEKAPFINRAIAGRYAPGSIVKPFIAAAALSEGVIDPEKEILSTGSISVQNPYDPDAETIFKDWKAHGLVDMRSALAVSSNVYFFTVGGGHGGQQGLGIERIWRVMERFGIGEKSGIDLSDELEGLVPTPAWKQSLYPDDPWRIGDTYNTSIGQYSFLVTPVQMVRATAAIANGGTLVTPYLVRDSGARSTLGTGIADAHLRIIREGMREAVTAGTGQALNISSIAVAAKTGTAELGDANILVNSWVIGFFPYERPRYAFAVVMERGPAKNLVGSAFVMRQVLEWLAAHKREYVRSAQTD